MTVNNESMSTIPQIDTDALKSRVARFREVDSEIVRQVKRVIVGQDEVLEQVRIGLFVGGHCLITGLPGTAKTLLVRTMADVLGLLRSEEHTSELQSRFDL